MLLNKIQFRTKVKNNTHSERQAAIRKDRKSPFPGARLSPSKAKPYPFKNVILYGKLLHFENWMQYAIYT